MAMESERSSSSKPLHNFSLPDGLRWGSQRFLRCMKVNSNGKTSAVVRRPSSSSSAASISPNNARISSNGFMSSGDRKRKEREEFIDHPTSAADYRRGSDLKKVGFNFKVPPSSHYTESSRKFRSSNGGSGGGEGDGIAAVREKLMFDLQTEADKMKDAILRDGFEAEDQEYEQNHASPEPAVSPATVAAPSSVITEGKIRPWNLRTRRAACKAPPPPNEAGTSGVGAASVVVSGKGLNSDVVNPDPNSSPLRLEENKAARLRSGVATLVNEKKDRAKFSVALTKREIEEDFFAFAGRRPPRRPHKRPRYVQKVLDTLFPGLWLTEITADMYKVVEMQ